MPPHSTPSDVGHLAQMTASLKTPMVLLSDLHDTFGTPFLLAISNTVSSLLSAIQTVKNNKHECIQLTENLHGILCAIINLHLESETPGRLHPTILTDLGRFAQTLHKIHTFVQIYEDGNKIKNFFRQSEINTLRKECRAGLAQALAVFKSQLTANLHQDVAVMDMAMQKMHAQLLELISTVSDETVSERSSMVQTLSQNSSSSFSVLPPTPKIFYGRENDLKHVVDILRTDSPRIAILGAGGMGKSSLARAALHHPDVAAKYEQRFFVVCDTVKNSIELANAVGAHIGLSGGQDLRKAVIKYLAKKSSCLLILDNFETPWEPLQSRDGVEEFLSLLTGLCVGLLITMRGTERPSKVRWTRPFLEPLKPLTNDAARQTFWDIAEDFHESEDIDRLLDLTDNMPLAINLVAHMVDLEGCKNVLQRWETEKTSLLSQGEDRCSSLDFSISMSLSSPRLESLPGAKALLSLLSVLPDGLSNVELVQTKFPIADPLACTSALLATSLAYYDNKKRLNSLVPIREYMWKFHPPSTKMITPLRKHFQLIVQLYEKFFGLEGMTAWVGELSANWGNIHNILSLELHANNPEIEDVITAAIWMNSFSRMTGHRSFLLMERIPAIFPKPTNHRLETLYAMELLNNSFHRSISNAEGLISEGISHLTHFEDLKQKAGFYLALGSYYLAHTTDMTAAMNSYETALTLSTAAQDNGRVASSLNHMSNIKWKLGDYRAAQRSASEGHRFATLSSHFYEKVRALRSGAVTATTLGDYKHAMYSLDQAQHFLRLCGMLGGSLHHLVMINKAEVHLLKSEYAEALSINTENLEATSADQDAMSHAYAVLNVAEIGVIIDVEEVRVAQHLQIANNLFNSIGYLDGLIYCDIIRADLKLREGEFVEADRLFRKCLAAGWGSEAQVVTYCMTRLADGKRWESGPFFWSSNWAGTCLAWAIKSQEKLTLHRALLSLADVFLFDGDVDTAKTLLVVALQGFTSMDVHHSKADCLFRLGNLAKVSGNMDEAKIFWGAARPLFERSMQAKSVAGVDLELSSFE